MIDLIIEKRNGIYHIYEILNGNKVIANTVAIYEYDDIIEYINENYEYARILVGKNIMKQ